MRSMCSLIIVCGLLVVLSACSHQDSITAPVGRSLGPQIIGEYKFTGNDGLVETGILISDDGHISMVSNRDNRESSVYANWIFSFQFEYIDPPGWINFGGQDFPMYSRGDFMEYGINIDYNGKLPLNLWPLLYAQLSAVHIKESGDILREGQWEEDISLEPMGEWTGQKYWVVSSSLFPAGQMMKLEISLELEFHYGLLELHICSADSQWYFVG